MTTDINVEYVRTVKKNAKYEQVFSVELTKSEVFALVSAVARANSEHTGFEDSYEIAYQILKEVVSF